MFKNIGHKIKVLSVVICWIGIIASILFGICIMLAGDVMNEILQEDGFGSLGSHNIVIGVIFMIAGSLSSWIGTFFLYGFGELIENSKKISDKLYGVEKGKKAEKKANKEDNQEEKQEDPETLPTEAPAEEVEVQDIDPLELEISQF